MTVELSVLTFKEGVLSRVAHDLRLRAGEVRVRAQGAGWVVEVPLGSLRVDCAMQKGQPAPTALSAANKAEIEAAMRDEVLAVGRHPTAVWSVERLPKLPSTATGRLQLHGAERPLPVSLRVEGGQLLARADLDQRAFGITPYRALLGTLKVQPVVRVEARRPWPWPG
jgi:hypothetical protein